MLKSVPWLKKLELPNMSLHHLNGCPQNCGSTDFPESSMPTEIAHLSLLRTRIPPVGGDSMGLSTAREQAFSGLSPRLVLASIYAEV